MQITELIQDKEYTYTSPLYMQQLKVVYKGKCDHKDKRFADLLIHVYDPISDYTFHVKPSRLSEIEEAL